MSNNQTEKPVKKRRSLWWLWLILILVAFAGGIILGLKLNTMPLPMQVKDKLYPVIESYIPGSTLPHLPGTAPEATAAPEATVAPEATAAPEEAITPETAGVPETTATPEAAFIPEATATPEAVAAPEVTPLPASEPGTAAEPTVSEPASPAATPAPEIAPAVEAVPAPENTAEVNLTVSETAAFGSDTPAPAKTIGIDAALRIALDHAECKEDEAEVDEVSRAKNDDGEAVYNVRFRVGEKNYHYVVDAFSGEILSWMLSGLSTSETLTFAADFQGNDKTETEAAAVQEMISLEQARDCAYAHAGVKATDVLQTSVELDQTGEMACYHVVFRTTDRRFDYSVDAYTGEILGLELR